MRDDKIFRKSLNLILEV